MYQNYISKVAARIYKYANCMKMLMEAYKFDENDPIMTSRLFVPLKSACGTNGPPEVMTL